MKAFMLATAAATLMAGAAHAQSYAQTESPALTLGAAVSVAPEYSGADDYESRVLPLIDVRKELTPGNTVYLKGLSVGLDHAVDERLTLGLKGKYRFERDSSDSAALTAMPDVDAAFELGPRVRFQATPQLGFEGEVMVDATNSYDGFTARAGTDYALPLSEVTMLRLGAGINYGSEDYMSTYYGVTAGQATATRPAYAPDGGISHLDASVSLRHKLTHNWSVQGNVGADYLLGDAADSPLVQEELQPRMMLGLAYSF